jgi:hypothetical protein
MMFEIGTLTLSDLALSVGKLIRRRQEKRAA